MEDQEIKQQIIVNKEKQQNWVQDEEVFLYKPYNCYKIKNLVLFKRKNLVLGYHKRTQ